MTDEATLESFWASLITPLLMAPIVNGGRNDVKLVYMMSDGNVQLLVNLGLGETEAGLYLTLGSEGKTVMELSKEIGVARTSIYAGLEKLAGKGLVEKVVEYKRQKYKRAKREMLLNLVKEEEVRLARMRQSELELERNLEERVREIGTEVRYYHRKQGFQQMMWNALGAEKGTVGWSEFGRVEVVGEKFTADWVEEFKKRGLRDRVLANPTKRVLEILEKRVGNTNHQLGIGDVRLVGEKEMYISGDTTIYNNVFAVCWWRRGEIVGVEIENEELVRCQRSLFEAMWSGARKYRK